jgi:RNA polymerase sigma factor (TIGR02999 family)
MESVTELLNSTDPNESEASDRLLLLLYEDLRKLALAKLALEKPGQTLQPTALVHEAYLRLVHGKDQKSWNSRAHFFGAAARAMRRILVENARRRLSLKRGGDHHRQEADWELLSIPMASETILALDEALKVLEAHKPEIAQLVNLRFFSGLPMEEAAEMLNISVRTAHRQWLYAKAFLRCQMEDDT